MESYPIEKVILLYNKHIYDRYKSLVDSGKKNELVNNNDLSKIFEYYSCIKLMTEYKQKFYEYDDINPEFKELHQMSRTDTGIDACNLLDTIVQCKLRQSNTNLNWKECATFFGSNVYTNEDDVLSIRWQKMIITRNSDCNLSKHFDCRKKSFLDKTYDKNEMLLHCNELVSNPPILSNPELIEKKIILRDYQIECKNIIMENTGETKSNIIICLPTGTGKNLIILHSLKPKTKYLILVPRIILMEQIKDEIKKHFPKLSSSVQCIGDGENVYDDKKYIYICVYNSIDIVKEYAESFEKIFIDEAHHIRTPEIYMNEDDLEEDDIDSGDEDNLEDEDDEEDNENDLEDNENDLDDTREPSQDEIKKSFITEISSLSRYNNNVYLSATIDKQEGFTYYYKDIREMIEKGYLCDYTIHIPIFTEDPTNKNVCEYLIKNYRNIIIYCNSQKEGNEINKLMNTIQKGSSQYIDCNTSKITRNKIINKYKSGELPFLVNVRILVEGFDSPISKGVVFMHLPSNGKTIIQIIGRCLRLHEGKTIANVILPFSAKEDENSINNFLKVMAKNDSRLRKSYVSKSLGGYISINSAIDDDKIDDDNDNDDKEDIEDDEIELKFNMIFDSMGKMKNSEELFLIRLENVKKYIDENNKRPSKHNEDKNIKFMGCWIGTQKQNYSKKINNMKDENIYKLWTDFINDEKYKEYIQLSTMLELFNINLNKLKIYIDTYKKRPSNNSKIKNIKIIAEWISTQKKSYLKKNANMKDKTIYKLWTDFINDEKYKEYMQLPTMLELFNINLNKVKNYIDTNKKRPSQSSKDKDIKCMGQWLHQKINNYSKKIHNMKDENIYKLWTEFINDEKYKEYFLSQYDTFVYNLNNLKSYIDTNKKRPSESNKDKNINFLGHWIGNCQINYSKKTHNMKDENIYKLWTKFINDTRYKEYFISQYDSFLYNLNNLKSYIDINKQRPSKHNKDKNIKSMGQWIGHCQKNYSKKKENMKDKNIYKLWTEFINDEKYKEYFLSQYDSFVFELNKIKIYIDTHNKRPLNESKDKNIKFLGNWIYNQNKNYSKKINNMKDENIYKLWTEFINDSKYKEYFLSQYDSFVYNLNKLKIYIDTYKKRPSTHSKDKNIKSVGNWIGTSQKNYSKKKDTMKDENIYKLWTEFINDEKYKQYFN
jgi:superfamily II DNA or RNA helicase